MQRNKQYSTNYILRNTNNKQTILRNRQGMFLRRSDTVEWRKGIVVKCTFYRPRCRELRMLRSSSFMAVFAPLRSSVHFGSVRKPRDMAMERSILLLWREKRGDISFAGTARFAFRRKNFPCH